MNHDLLEKIERLQGWTETNQEILQKKFVFLNNNEAIKFSLQISEQNQEETILEKNLELKIKNGTLTIIIFNEEGLTQHDIDLAKKINQEYSEQTKITLLNIKKIIQKTSMNKTTPEPKKIIGSRTKKTVAKKTAKKTIKKLGLAKPVKKINK